MTAPDQNDASGASLPGQGVEADAAFAQTLANRGPHILRGIYRDKLVALITAHRLATTPVDPNAVKPPEGGELREAVNGWFVADRDIRGRIQIRHRGKHVEYVSTDDDAAYGRMEHLRWTAICAALASTDTPASKPEQSQVPMDMTAWHGGYSAPSNYEHGDTVAFRDGSTGGTTLETIWSHDGGFDDIIAYTPASKPIASNAAVERMAKAIDAVIGFHTRRQQANAAAKRVAAALTEPVAPDDGAGASSAATGGGRGA